MKNKLFIISITIAVFSLIISIATFYFLFKNDLPHVVKIPNDLPSHQATTKISESTEWKTYKNTKYGYKFEYPSKSLLQKVAEMEPVDLNKSESITLGIPGVGNKLRVYVWREYTNAPKELQDKHNLLFIQPLDIFAKEIYSLQQLDNSKFEDRTLTDLERVSFKNKTSFEFNLDKVINLDQGGFPFSKLNKCIIVENNDYKIIITYPISDDVSEKIINSFEFIND